MLEATEIPWLWAGLGAYFVATVVSIFGVVPRMVEKRQHEKLILALLVLGVTLLMVAIAARWVRIGHGPWISLFELLMSQLWSLGLIFAFLYFQRILF